MSPPLPFCVKNLSCRYPGRKNWALRDISFSIVSGTINGVLGPNGAGKSTLLKSSIGLLPYEGSVSFSEQSFESNRDKIAYIPQRNAIDWDFPVSALDVCLMGIYPRIGWLRRIKGSDKEEALHYLEKVGLEDFAHRQIGALSGGQQQRVFMARALAQKADLFLLDEPMAGIDQKTQDLLFDLFQSLKKEGKTIVIVHHNLYTAKEHFDYVVLLNQSLVDHGYPTDVLTQDTINKAYNTVTV
ncbi:MAG: metal ABC transporter ATP-binding protein [Alphaproteobacteria bacterium]